MSSNIHRKMRLIAKFFLAVTLTIAPSLTFSAQLSEKDLQIQTELSSLASDADLQFIKGDYKDAMSMIDKLIAAHPKFSFGYYTRGTMHFRLDELGLALADFNKAIEIDPEYVASYKDKSNTLAKQCHDADARLALQQYIKKATPYGNLYDQGIASAKYDLSNKRLNMEASCPQQ